MATIDERTPLTVELRTVELGTPTTTLVAEEAQVVLSPLDVQTSTDASVATRVTFSSPILVEPRTEYAIVLLSPTSDKYTAWVARLGERAVSGTEGVENNIYSRQYGAGALFKSQNGSIWEASSFEDMKFQVNIAQFVAESGVLTLQNPDLTIDSGIIPNLPRNPIKALPRKLSVGITTVETADMKNILGFGRKVGYGNTVTGFIENVGGPISGLNITLTGTGYSAGTYTGVNFFSEDGNGSGATGVVTVSSSGEISQVSIANSGTGYIEGESLGIITSSIFKGTGGLISVGAITGYDTLYTTNVNGQEFVADRELVYYDDSNTAVSLANTTVSSSTVYDQFYTGNVLEVLHPRHAMHAINNVLEIKNVKPNTEPTAITADVLNTDNTISVADTTAFGNFQGVTTSQGYALLNNEVLYYTSIGNGTLGIATRGAENSLASRHFNGDLVYPYSFAGVSLAQINKQINMPSNPTLQDAKDMDRYYVEISRGDRPTGDDQLNFNDEIIGGGDDVWISRNIQYDQITTNLDILTPGDTAVTGRIRSVSATSAGGLEESFEDAGFQPTSLNTTIIYPEPKMIASKVNEVNQSTITSLPRSKSLTIEVDLIATDDDGRFSPVVFADQISVDLDRTRLNRPINDYVNDPRANSVNNDPHTSSYVSQVIDLANPATSLRVLTSAYVDETAQIRCFYRVFSFDSQNIEPKFVAFPGYDNLKDTDADGYGDQIIDPTKLSGLPDKEVPPSLQDEFREHQFSVDDLQPFDRYQIKICFSGTNEALAPRLKDIRTIALA